MIVGGEGEDTIYGRGGVDHLYGDMRYYEEDDGACTVRATGDFFRFLALRDIVMISFEFYFEFFRN